MSDYEKQAQVFLDKCGATMTAKFLRNGPYFPDDKDSRDIYKITISRPVRGEEYTFTFGQSLANSGRQGDYVNGQKANKRIAPSAYSVLACLTKYEPESDTWAFAHEYGYAIESRADYNRIDKLCMDVMSEYQAVCRLFGDVLDDLREIS